MSTSLQKQHHINQLLTTAAGGTGVVGDVDALLAPIPLTPIVRTEAKAERNLWREEEMRQMLNLMLQANAIDMLNDKSVKSEKVFRNIERLMFDCGYRKKSYMQIWTKWKFLKSTYMTSRRAGVIPKMIPFSIYQVLHDILTNSRNVSSGVGGTIANGTLGGSTSVDGDNSESGRLVISQVESVGVTNGVIKGSKKSSETTAAAESSQKSDEVSDFDMAHPIFGFRLGMVKQEPVDSGYEASHIKAAASEPDALDENNEPSPDCSLANTDFHSDIKQELMEVGNRDLFSCTAQKRPESPVKTLEVSSPTALPPLRIAPFAKAPPVNTQRQFRQQQFNSSPPPLSIHPLQPQEQQPQTHHHYTRQNHAHSTNTWKNSRKSAVLLRKVVPRQYRVVPTTVSGAPIRLPRDITIHQTRPSSSTAAAARLKQASMRQLSYGTRHPDTALSDLKQEQTALQQQQKIHSNTMKYAPSAEPSTSQHAAAATMNGFPAPAHNQRKRRLQLPHPNYKPLNHKQSRMFQRKKHAQDEHVGGYQQHRFYQDQQAENLDSEDALEQPSFEKKKAKQQQKHFQARQPQTERKNEEGFFEAAFKELGASLRSAQCDIMNEFFEKQMEMVRMEHEFQARQDKLLMQAFAEQTQLILSSAKSLFEVDAPDLKKQVNASDPVKAEQKSETGAKEKQTQPDRVEDRGEKEVTSEPNDEGYEQQEDYLDGSSEGSDDETSEERNDSDCELGVANGIKSCSVVSAELNSVKLFENI